MARPKARVNAAGKARMACQARAETSRSGNALHRCTQRRRTLGTGRVLADNAQLALTTDVASAIGYGNDVAVLNRPTLALGTFSGAGANDVVHRFRNLDVLGPAVLTQSNLPTAGQGHDLESVGTTSLRSTLRLSPPVNGMDLVLSGPVTGSA